MNLYEILRRPLVTEKISRLQTQGKYAFEVADGVNKNEIKQAVETAYKVDVTGVNVTTVRGKKKHMGRRVVQTLPWKKAVVTLKQGDKIEFFKGV